MERTQRRFERKRFLALTGLAVGAQMPLLRGTALAESYTLRMYVPTPADSVFGLAGTHYASAVRNRTNGQVTVDVYPNGQLSSEKDTIEGLISGVLDFAIISSGFVGTVMPTFQVFDVPFLFKDAASGYRAFEGAVGKELFDSLETKGIIGLGWGIGGFKEFETTTRPIVTPEDMKGMRMRYLGGAIYAAAYQALGAIPVAVDFSESLTALSQHTIDGVDFILDGFTTGRFYTVCKHVAISNHTISVEPLLGSKRKIDALPAPIQKIIREEGKKVVPFWREIVARQNLASIDFLKKNGVTFTEIQYASFRKVMDPIYATYGPRLGGGLLDRVSRAANGG